MNGLKRQSEFARKDFLGYCTTPWVLMIWDMEDHEHEIWRRHSRWRYRFYLNQPKDETWKKQYDQVMLELKSLPGAADYSHAQTEFYSMV